MVSTCEAQRREGNWCARAESKPVRSQIVVSISLWSIGFVQKPKYWIGIFVCLCLFFFLEWPCQSRGWNGKQIWYFPE